MYMYVFFVCTRLYRVLVFITKIAQSVASHFGWVIFLFLRCAHPLAILLLFQEGTKWSVD